MSSKIPADFLPTHRYPTRSQGGRSPWSRLCVARSVQGGTRISLSTTACSRGNIQPDKRYTIMELANGMFALLPDPEGFNPVKPSTSSRTIIRIPRLTCRFRNMEAELLHGMWVFPKGTFAPFSENPEATAVFPE